MATVIKTLNAPNGDIILPRTRSAAVTMADGTTTLDGITDIWADVTSTASELNILDGATLTVTELNYVDGVTSAIQTQLNAKFNTTTLYTATITDTWTGASAPYTQDVTVSGMTSNDTPTICPVYSGTYATAVLQNTAWLQVSQIVTGTDKITCTVFGAKPVTAIPIQIKGV